LKAADGDVIAVRAGRITLKVTTCVAVCASRR
jgi:hypothetical protein